MKESELTADLSSLLGYDLIKEIAVPRLTFSISIVLPSLTDSAFPGADSLRFFGWKEVVGENFT